MQHSRLMYVERRSCHEKLRTCIMLLRLQGRRDGIERSCHFVVCVWPASWLGPSFLIFVFEYAKEPLTPSLTSFSVLCLY